MIISDFYKGCIALNLDINGLALSRVNFGINSGTHEEGTGGSASDEIDPDSRPSKRVLKWTNRQKSSRGGKRSASVDQTSDSTKRLAASTNRRVRSQIGGDGRRNDVIGSAVVVNAQGKTQKKSKWLDSKSRRSPF